MLEPGRISLGDHKITQKKIQNTLLVIAAERMRFQILHRN